MVTKVFVKVATRSISFVVACLVMSSFVVNTPCVAMREIYGPNSKRGEWWEANVDKNGRKIEVRSERIERETKENLKRFNEEMSKVNVFQHKKLEGVFKNADNVKADAALKKEVFAVAPVGLKASTQDSPAVPAADPFSVQEQLTAIAKKSVAEGSELADATAEKIVPTENLKPSLDTLTDGLGDAFAAEKAVTLVCASHEDENKKL